jgi:hypothetical protein
MTLWSGSFSTGTTVGWEASWEKRKAGMEKRAIKWSFMEAPVRWEYGTAGERGMEQGRGKREERNS